MPRGFTGTHGGKMMNKKELVIGSIIVSVLIIAGFLFTNFTATGQAYGQTQPTILLSKVPFETALNHYKNVKSIQALYLEELQSSSTPLDPTVAVRDDSTEELHDELFNAIMDVEEIFVSAYSQLGTIYRSSSGNDIFVDQIIRLAYLDLQWGLENVVPLKSEVEGLPLMYYEQPTPLYLSYGVKATDLQSRDLVVGNKDMYKLQQRLASLSQRQITVLADEFLEQVELIMDRLDNNQMSSAKTQVLLSFFPISLAIYEYDKVRGESSGIRKLYVEYESEFNEGLRTKGVDHLMFYNHYDGNMVVRKGCNSKPCSMDAVDLLAFFESLRRAEGIGLGDCMLYSMVDGELQELPDESKLYLCPSMPCSSKGMSNVKGPSLAKAKGGATGASVSDTVSSGSSASQGGGGTTSMSRVSPNQQASLDEINSMFPTNGMNSMNLQALMTRFCRPGGSLGFTPKTGGKCGKKGVQYRGQDSFLTCITEAAGGRLPGGAPNPGEANFAGMPGPGANCELASGGKKDTKPEPDHDAHVKEWEKSKKKKKGKKDTNPDNKNPSDPNSQTPTSGNTEDGTKFNPDNPPMYEPVWEEPGASDYEPEDPTSPAPEPAEKPSGGVIFSYDSDGFLTAVTYKTEGNGKTVSVTYELDREGNPTGGVSYHNLDKKSARDKVALYGAMRKVAEGMMGGDRPYWEMANAASERFLGSGLMSAAEAGRLSSLYRHVWNSCADPSTCSSTCTGAGKMISKANECYGKLFRSFDKALGRQTRTDLPSHRGPGSDPRTERPSGIANPTPTARDFCEGTVLPGGAIQGNGICGWVMCSNGGLTLGGNGCCGNTLEFLQKAILDPNCYKQRCTADVGKNGCDCRGPKKPIGKNPPRPMKEIITKDGRLLTTRTGGLDSLTNLLNELEGNNIIKINAIAPRSQIMESTTDSRLDKSIDNEDARLLQELTGRSDGFSRETTRGTDERGTVSRDLGGNPDDS